MLVEPLQERYELLIRCQVPVLYDRLIATDLIRLILLALSFNFTVVVDCLQSIPVDTGIQLPTLIGFCSATQRRSPCACQDHMYLPKPTYDIPLHKRSCEADPQHKYRPVYEGFT
jgi:hypothetical protein